MKNKIRNEKVRGIITIKEFEFENIRMSFCEMENPVVQ